MSDRITHHDVVSPFCQGGCDDHRITVDGNKIVAVQGGCELGRMYFPSTDFDATGSALIDGQVAAFDDAIRRAAEILSNAAAPLVFGLEHLTCESQSLAVTIAERLGGTIDSPASVEATLLGTATQSVGSATCTLGELRDRADFVLLWDVFTCQVPCQLFGRLSPISAADFFNAEVKDRTVIILEEIRRTSDSEDQAAEARIKQRASQVIGVREGRSFEVGCVLRALVKNASLDAATVVEQTGIALEAWQSVTDRMRTCSYGVVVASTYDPQVERGLNELMIELNRHTRFAYLGINKAGINHVGAEQVLASRTGFPCAVDFASGRPVYAPAERSASAVLERGETDAVLLFGYPNDVTTPIDELVARVPVVAVAHGEADQGLKGADVYIRTAQPGIAAAGTIFRFDGVPLPLRKLIDSPLPTTENVLTRLIEAIQPR